MAVGSISGSGGASASAGAHAAHSSTSALKKVAVPDKDEFNAMSAVQVQHTQHKPSVSPLAHASHGVQAAVSTLGAK